MKGESILEKVLVLLDENKDEGKLATTAVRTRANTGIVKSVGEKVTDVAVGERVFFSPNLGMDIELDGKSYVSLHVSMIEGKIVE